MTNSFDVQSESGGYNVHYWETNLDPNESRLTMSSAMKRQLNTSPAVSRTRETCLTQGSSLWSMSQAINCIKTLSRRAATSRATRPMMR